MSYVQSFGQYFGLFGGDLEEVNKGKRRTVLWFTFVTWCILIGSTAGPDWILGGLEFGNANQGQTAGQAHFHVNLNTVLIEVNRQDTTYFNGNWYNSENKFARSDFLKRASTQATFVLPNSPYANTAANGYATNNVGPNSDPSKGGKCSPPDRGTGYIDVCTNLPSAPPNNICRGEQNWWCGTKMSTKVNSAVDDTLGLMVVSCICTGFAWLFMTMISQGNVATQRKYFYEATCGLMVASAFFTMCAASVMDGSQLKNIFCGVFDPDANIGVYCGYGDGFYAAIVGLFFSALTAVLFWFWMPHADAGGASYAYKSNAFEDASPSTATATAPAFQATSGTSSTGSDYQGFGSSSSTL